MKKKLLLLVVFSTIASYSQNVVFGDLNLKNYFLDEYIIPIDVNGDREIQISEAQSVTSLVFSGRNSAGVAYTSFQGIEAFTNIMHYEYTETQDVGMTSFNLTPYTSLTDVVINTYRLNNYEGPPVVLNICSITYQTTSNSDLHIRMSAFAPSLKGSTLASVDFGRGVANYIFLDLQDGPEVLDLTGISEIFTYNTSYDVKVGGTDLILLNNGWRPLTATVKLTSPNTYICVDFDDQQNVNVHSDFPYIVGSYCDFTPGAYNGSGTIRVDENNEECSSLNPVVPHFSLISSQAYVNQIISSDSNGHYNFNFDQDSDVQVNQFLQNDFFESIYGMFMFYMSNTTNHVWNICLKPVGIHNDVEVVMVPLNSAVPGFDAQYKIIFRNKGNRTLNGRVSLTYDDLTSNLVQSTPQGAVDDGSVSWAYENLRPFEEREIVIVFNLNSASAIVGDTVLYSVSITPTDGDEVASDNNFVLKQSIVSTMNVNNVVCAEGSSVQPERIGDYLHYVVNFENTGNTPVSFVVVKDVIDALQYDINSIQVLNSSHNVYTRISNNNVEFIFENINLEANGGRGNVVFKIKTKSNLVINSSVSQKADIHFDYKFPITTNNAVTTFEVLNTNVLNKENRVKVYPNPAESLLNVDANVAISKVMLYDMQGRLLQTAGDNTLRLKMDVSAREAGLYLLKIFTATETTTERIVKH